MHYTFSNNSPTISIGKAILFCMLFTSLFFILSSTLNFAPAPFEKFAQGVTGTVAALLSVVIFLKFERRRFSDIGLVFQRSTITRFFIGVLLGICIMGLLVSGVLFFTKTVVSVNPTSTLAEFLLATAPLLLLALMEELGFRSYPLELLRKKIGIRSAIIITSLLFALYHVAMGWSIPRAFSGPAIWGLLFGIAAIYSKGIALPTGMHYAVNLTTSAFGDKDTKASLWTIEPVTADTVQRSAIDWTVIIPSLVILFLAIICMELHIRREKKKPLLEQ
jgi:membrane protease YdiL (CAAX protease family)